MRDPEIVSIQAIQDCMNFLGLQADQHRSPKVSAKIINPAYSKYQLPIQVTFCNEIYSHKGPYIEFDDVIRGYRLQYEVYKPQFQDFSFNRNGKEGHLKVDHCKGEYHFELIFLK